MDENLKGAHAKDEVGNRYKITAHYGGVGLPIPEMICMTLEIKRNGQPYKTAK